MITCHIMGGLGNQLFQIFATIAYAIDNQAPFGFKCVEQPGDRPRFWNTFLSGLKRFNIYEIINVKQLKETGFRHEIFPSLENDISQNIMLYGYFQSYKYFEKRYTSICKLIRLDLQKEQIIDNFRFNFSFQQVAYGYDDMVSMHFRLGDYKEIQEKYPIMPVEYYKRCISHIIETTGNSALNILYFCEIEDNEDVLGKIKQLRDRFPLCKFIKVDDSVDDWKQMLMMSCCRHNIIANSSFSWWSAYFNSHTDKIVCYPSQWFGYFYAHNDTTDLCPDSWKKIDVSTC
uniref:Glycosyltransferase n=1 Tax=viral metagenome TaxID=1070528 RepID=A0A6C0HYA9_9ZZZZ